MRGHHRCTLVGLASGVLFTMFLGCNGGPASIEDRDAALQSHTGNNGGVEAGNTGGAPGGDCNMTGRWVAIQVTFSTSLGMQQRAVNWYYHEISQLGDVFTIDKSLNCGIRVTGTTTVTLSDATTEALAVNNKSSLGRKGIFRKSHDGTTCEFKLDRTYDLRGANRQRFLSDTWQVGDPPKALGEFPALPRNASEGMEDWDNDGKEGISLITGLGVRYVAQRDWNEHTGSVSLGASLFGGESIAVTWDGQEAVSTQTTALLRTASTPAGTGYARYARLDDDLEVVQTGEHEELATCKNAQRLALELFGDS